MDIREIREGVAKVLYGELTYQNYLTIPKLRQNADLKIDQILSYLAEKDACFPVEGELPIPYTPVDGLGVMNESYAQGAKNQREIILKVGYKKVITLKEMMGGDK